MVLGESTLCQGQCIISEYRLIITFALLSILKPSIMLQQTTVRKLVKRLGKYIGY